MVAHTLYGFHSLKSSVYAEIWDITSDFVLFYYKIDCISITTAYPYYLIILIV